MNDSLASLAVDRRPGQPPPPRRPVGGRLVAAGLALAVALAAWLLWQRLQPALPVEVMAVAAATEAVTGTAAGVVARASGWIHPDPHAITVSAQRAGSLDRILVVAGEAVAAGTVLAELDPADARLGLRRADAAVAAAEAGVAVAVATTAAAAARLAQAVDRCDRLRGAMGTASAEALAQAAHEVEVRRAELVVDRRGEDEATVRRAALSVEREAAELDLARCTIRAPQAGIVLRLHAQPGQRLGLDDAGTARLAELFDPGRQQVRADVALGEAGAVHAGQAAEITCDLLPGLSLAGRVTGSAGSADAARNTLQVHIALSDPPASLRPDMLVRVRILGEPTASPGQPAGPRLLAPSAGLRGAAGATATAWIIDAQDRLRRRSVELAGDDRQGWTPVSAGLLLGDLVVVGADTGLHEGRRASVRYTQER